MVGCSCAIIMHFIRDINANLTCNYFVHFRILSRENYDVHVNQISVSVLFGSHYTVTDGILMLKQVNIKLHLHCNYNHHETTITV